MRRSPRFLVLVIAALAGLMLAAACGEEEAKLPEVTVTAADYAFALPDSVAGGLVDFKLTNSGKEDHHAQFFHLNSGVTQQQFLATVQSAVQALPTEGEAALFKIFEVSTFAGGPGIVAPGKTIDAITNLSAGEYALLCFVSSPDGVFHFAKGMVKPLSVTAAPAKQAAPPTAAGTVELVDFAFATIPSEISSKRVLWAVNNKGAEPHEMAILRPKGVSITELQQALTAPPPPPGSAPPSEPPPFEFAGGYQAMMPGESGWVSIELPPGEYAMICFIPSPANEFKPHVALGMFKAFTVN